MQALLVKQNSTEAEGEKKVFGGGDRLQYAICHVSSCEIALHARCPTQHVHTVVQMRVLLPSLARVAAEDSTAPGALCARELRSRRRAGVDDAVVRVVVLLNRLRSFLADFDEQLRIAVLLTLRVEEREVAISLLKAGEFGRVRGQ